MAVGRLTSWNTGREKVGQSWAITLQVMLILELIEQVDCANFSFAPSAPSRNIAVVDLLNDCVLVP